jgi:hypothetical protein
MTWKGAPHRGFVAGSQTERAHDGEGAGGGEAQAQVGRIRHLRGPLEQPNQGIHGHAAVRIVQAGRIEAFGLHHRDGVHAERCAISR